MIRNSPSNGRLNALIAAVAACAGTAGAMAGGEQVSQDAPLHEDARHPKDLSRIPRQDEWGGTPLIEFGKQRVPTAGLSIEGPTQIGVTINGGPGFALVDMALDAAWDVTPKLQPIARVRVRSDGADSLRLKFEEGAMPSGAVLRVYDGGGRMVAARSAQSKGDWWTGSIQGEVALLEYIGPADDASMPDIRVATLGVIDPAALLPAGAAARFVNSCNGGGVDLTCHAEVPSPTDLQRSVVRMNFASDGGGIVTCSGALVRDAQGNAARPYILTAAHCIDSASEASSVEVVWFYHAQGGVLPCLRDLPFNEGAMLGATIASCDMTVLVLSSAPPAEAVAAQISTAAVGTAERGFISIHHAGGGPQRYWARPAIGRGSCSTADGSWRSPQSIEFPFVQGQSTGTFEGGASGAPLFDSQGRVRGTVRGICYPGGANYDFCARPGEVRHYFGSIAEAWRLGLSAGFTQPPADDSFEPNNALGQARQIGATGAAYPLQLLDLDDYFSIVLTVAGRLEVLIEGTPTVATNSFDPDLFLLNSVGAELLRSDSPTARESVALDVQPGTYIVRVQRFTAGTVETGSYRLTPRFTPAVQAPSAGTTTPPAPLPTGSSGTETTPAPPIATSPVVDRQITAMNTRLDRLVTVAGLRSQRIVDGLRIRVPRLRDRGVSEEVIAGVISANRAVVESLRLSTTLGLVRTSEATSRVLDKLARRPGELADAATAAKESSVPPALAAALERLTSNFDALGAAFDEIQATGG
jgi:hypothetical protein